MGYVGLTMPVTLARWSFTVYGVNASSAVLARPGHDSARLGELRPRIPGTGANQISMARSTGTSWKHPLTAPRASIRLRPLMLSWTPCASGTASGSPVDCGI
jgi:hypothetical protein